MSLRLKAPLSALALGALALSACRDVNRQPPPDSIVLAAFVTPDPTATPPVLRSVVPLPSDLAMRGAPQQPPGATREVLFSFIDAGGFPGDQSIAIPFRKLVRNPGTADYDNSAEPPAEIDPATITAQTVAIVSLDSKDAAPIAPEFMSQGIDPVQTDIRVVRIRPKGGLPAGRYVVALRGGANGVKTVEKQVIGADGGILLIAPNKDLTNPENQPPPPNPGEPGLTPAQVAALEGQDGKPGLRQLFAVPYVWSKVPSEPACVAAFAGAFPPVTAIPEGKCWLPTRNDGPIDAFAAVSKVFPNAQAASLQTFTVSAPAVVVDSATGVVPFPSDFLLGGNGKVVPIPGLPPQLSQALTTLDGFSTTSLDLIPLSGPVDATTITPASVLLFDIGTPAAPHAPTPVTALGGGSNPVFMVQPPSLVVAAGPTARASTAIGLQPAYPVDAPERRAIYLPDDLPATYLPPLQPKHRYLVMVTDGVKDLAGKPLVRGTVATLLLTIDTPIFDGQHSTVPGISDAQAQGLQALRNLLRQVAPGVEAATGQKVVMGYTITTQSVTDGSAGLAVLPAGTEQRAGGATVFTTTVIGDVPLPGLPPTVARVVDGTVTSLQLMDPATGGLDAAKLTALSPLNPAWSIDTVNAAKVEIPVTVVIPKLAASCTPAALCDAPVVMFHHGINGGRYQMLGAMAELAGKGFIVAAVDAPFHGDRSYCASDADCAAGGTCVPQFLDPPTNSIQNQIAPAVCSNNQLARDALGTPVAAGNYFISSNFFRIRDAIRQDVFDQSAAIVALARAGASDEVAAALAEHGVRADPARVYWTGISLGNIIGTSVVATNARISRAGLNVPGGTLTDVFTNAPAFHDDVQTLLAGLIPGFSFDKANPTNPAFDPAIAADYAQLLVIAKWVLDPADPINYAAGVTGHGATVYGQMVRGDGVVPNPYNKLLFENADIPFVEYITASTTDPGQLHGLLLANANAGFPPAAVTAGAKVRADLANFLAGEGAPPTGEINLDAP